MSTGRLARGAVLLLLPIGTLVWWIWHGGDATAASTERAQAAAVRAGHAGPAQVQASASSDPGRRDPALRAMSVKERLAPAKRGGQVAVERDFNALAMSACGRMEIITGRAPSPPEIEQPPIAEVRSDPWRAWALDYLERACAGYDATAAMKRWRPEVADVILADDMGVEAATSVALDDLRSSGSITELMLALESLERSGALPEGMALQRDGVHSRLRVYEFAIEPIRCAAMGSCRGPSLETAWRCIDVGCPPGTTNEQLLRANMPQSEVAAGLALRDALMRYRAAFTSEE